jgi:hypothetical protein
VGRPDPSEFLPLKRVSLFFAGSRWSDRIDLCHGFGKAKCVHGKMLSVDFQQCFHNNVFLSWQEEKGEHEKRDASIPMEANSGPSNMKGIAIENNC